MNPSHIYLDIHVLQTVPPSCLNRDDTGSPKTAVYGGARRARVSSQSWKRAARMRFNATLAENEIATRTRKLPGLILDSVLATHPDANPEQAESLAAEAAGLMIGMKSVDAKKLAESKGEPQIPFTLFVPRSVVSSAAQIVANALSSNGELDDKALRGMLAGGHTLDIALFGRMVATAPDLNVDAACQVAHSISTHAVAQEFDFFTAVDDEAEGRDETGAAMMGLVEFSSATLYRYATINVAALADNLGGEDVVPQACRLFTDAFVRSIPTGKQNSFAAHTPPDVVLAVARTDQPISLVGAFEKPVVSRDGYVKESAQRLADRVVELDTSYPADGTRRWYTATPAAGDLSKLGGSPIPLPDLLGAVETEIGARLGASR